MAGSNTIEGGTAEFPDASGTMTASTTIPNSNDIINPNTGTTIVGGGSTGGGSGSQIGGMIGKAVGSAFGPIGSAVGGIFGDLFGGLFAEGGEVNTQNAMHKAVGLGYVIGALHQRDFGGTPQTLLKAAEMVKQMMSQGQQEGLAQGGQVADGNAIQQAIAQAMGLGDQSRAPNVAAANQVNNQQAAPISGTGMNTPTSVGSPTGMLNLQEQANSGNQSAQAFENGIQRQQKPQQGGYMQGFADGGPPMAPDQGQKPLQPGQTFQGDGSVKGPGGPTDDAIPAKLSNGEFVMSAPAVKFFGVDKLTKMNEQGKQGYMQALGQVQQNQQGAPPQGQPGQPQPPTPGAAPPQQPPQMQIPPGSPPQGGPPGGMKKGGMAMRNTRGFMGM